MTASPGPTDTEALELLLESIAAENAVSRGLVSQLLFEKFTKNKSPLAQRVCAIEIFCKLMEIVEDMGAFCVMWLTGGPDPLKSYLAVSTPDILSFYAECLTGLPDEKILKIVPVETPESLTLEGYLKTDDEKQAYGLLFDKELKNWSKNFTTSAKLYSRLGEESGKPRHADVLNMFFNAKHGRKSLHPKARLAHKFQLIEKEIAIIAPNTRLKGKSNGQPHWEILKFGLTDQLVKKMHDDTRVIADQLAMLAKMRLSLMKDPDIVKKDIRNKLPALIAIAKKASAPEAPCPCGNGKTFAGCHGRD